MIPQSKNEKIIFKGKLHSQESINLDMSKYNKLQITYAMYDYSQKNTAGCSNIVLLDLTTRGESNTAFQCSITHPYNLFQDDTTASVGSNMYAAFEVDSEKTSFKAIFGYAGKLQEPTTSQYYVSKIVGIL